MRRRVCYLALTAFVGTLIRVYIVVEGEAQLRHARLPGLREWDQLHLVQTPYYRGTWKVYVHRVVNLPCAIYGHFLNKIFEQARNVIGGKRQARRQRPLHASLLNPLCNPEEAVRSRWYKLQRLRDDKSFRMET